MNSGIFPVDLTGVTWSSDASVYSKPEQSWLFCSGSLTKKLKDFKLPFSVSVLSEKSVVLSDDEKASFGENSANAKIREVFLCVDSRPWVYAQSVLPEEALKTGFASLSDIGNKPLGELLFTSKDVQRGALSAASFLPDSQLHHFLAQYSQTTTQTLIGRRSFFSCQNSVISVAEIFLPSCPVYR